MGYRGKVSQSVARCVRMTARSTDTFTDFFGLRNLRHVPPGSCPNGTEEVRRKHEIRPADPH